MSKRKIEDMTLSVDCLRIDSTVTDSNIAPPRDSQLLANGVRVLSRLMTQSKNTTGVKIRFTDQRKNWKSLSHHISLAKKLELLSIGSSLAPGSGAPHVELKDSSGQRIDTSGSPVNRRDARNHTPIDFDTED